MTIKLLLREDPPQFCELSEEAAIALAKRMLALTKEASPLSEITASVPEYGWERSFSVKQACVFGTELCEAIRESQAEARRAAGYSPVAEEVAVRRDEKGEIVGTSKQLRY